MDLSDLTAVAALLVSLAAVGVSVAQTSAARRANRHAEDSAEASIQSSRAAVDSNRLAETAIELARAQNRRDFLRENRERTGWAIERAASEEDYTLMNVGHEFAAVHALQGQTKPKMYADGVTVLSKGGTTDFSITENADPARRWVTVVWTTRDNSFTRSDVPLPAIDVRREF
ncbi:hypothetical protein ACX80I_00975 [Arthrobacter sp. MDT3-44]